LKGVRGLVGVVRGLRDLKGGTAVSQSHLAIVAE
jgi:hypothetical protein